MPKITGIIKEIEQQLHHYSPDTLLKNQTAWWIIEAITRKSKAQLLLVGTITLTPEQRNILANWLDKLIQQKMPLQYILGSVPFGNLSILVEPPTLIPRPETEEWCLNLIERLSPLYHQALTILDMCSGSGCIGLAFAQALPLSKVYALDISAQAIELGKKNAHHNAITNITFTQSDLFSAITSSHQFDLIVSNPPYIAHHYASSLDDSVTEWEDARALFADDDGLAIIKKIITIAPKYLKKNSLLKNHHLPQIALEIDHPQAAAVQLLLKNNDFNNIKTYYDLEGKERVIMGSISDVAATKNKQ